jgi:hypothetical protein
MYNIQQLRNFLDLVNDDPFCFISKSRQLLNKCLRPQTVGFVLVRCEQVDIERSYGLEMFLEQESFSSSARSK